MGSAGAKGLRSPSDPLPNTEGLRRAQVICQELLDIVTGLCREHNLRYWLDGGTLLGAVRHGGFIPWDDDVDVCLPLADYRKLLALLDTFCAENPEYLLYFGPAGIPYWCESFGKTTWLIDGVLPVRIDLIPVKLVSNTPVALAEDKSLTDAASLWTLGRLKYPESLTPLHRSRLPGKHDLVREKSEFYAWFWTRFGPDPAEVSPSATGDWCVGYSFNDALVAKTRQLYAYSDIFPLKPLKFAGKSYLGPADTDAYLQVLYGPRYMELPPESQRRTHFSQLYRAQQSPGHVRELLDMVHHAGFRNLALEAWNAPNWHSERRLRRMSSFLRLFAGLLIRGHFRSAQNLVRYSRLHLSRL
jgi:lipopolysaccharide cholinephosphotransferase